MEPIKVVLVWTKETKGTHRYDAPAWEEAEKAGIRTLYVPKHALPAQRPDAISVTVEAATS
jgi:hypothetical protein